MKNLILKIAVLIPLIPITLFVIGIFVFSYIEYMILIFKVYSQLF